LEVKEMHTDTEAAPVTGDEVAARYGSAAAALIAAGIGCFVLGLFTTLNEVSSTLSDGLNWWNSVGPLSGKTALGVFAWIISWAILWPLYRNKRRSLWTAFIIMVVLIVIGLVLTFPPFFELFAAE
jgi:hypothetical protein